MSLLGVLGLISPGFAQPGKLDRFTVNEFFNEQVFSYTYPGDVKIHINAPNPDSLRPDRLTRLVFFALPNGNSTAWTIGKEAGPGEDWHYEIQHIGAQTRFLRELARDCNIVTIYLEADGQSWPAWSSNHPADRYTLIHAIVDSVRRTFDAFPHEVVLNGHSGGGSWVINFINSVDTIPSYIKRIAFLDSDYNYSDASNHGTKLAQWLSQSDDHYLCVIAYNDSIALLDGVPIVSATGGTWYRSKMMQKKLAEYFTFNSTENTEFIKHFALNGRIQFWLKHNPTRGILHTVQVERNGYIHSVVSGTAYDHVNYQYYGDHAYDQYIQKLPPEDILYLLARNDSNGAVRLSFQKVEHGDIYRVYWGKNGVTFTDSLDSKDSTIVLPGLSQDSLYYIQVQGISFWGKSVKSDVLACSQGTDPAKVIIINGFDTISDDNTREFVFQHANAFHSNGLRVASASNDALTSGMLTLDNYPILDFIVGTDYYQNESISPAEQTLLTAFLQKGGCLLISGNDLAYDMDSKGKAEQKEFCANFLKMNYLSRSPGNKTSTYYQMEFLPLWSDIITPLFFDNGTHGTYNVSRPNAVQAVNGGQSFLAYTGVDTTSGVAGVVYTGLFPNGTVPGKLVATCVPVETIYPDSIRTFFIKTVLDYFNRTTVVTESEFPETCHLALEYNYPNPFNASTRIVFRLPSPDQIELSIFNCLGQRVITLAKGFYPAGRHEIIWESRTITSGIYFCQLESNHQTLSRKILLLK